MYLSGRQTPDFRTICRFRRNHIKDIEDIFQQVARLCKGLDMVGIDKREDQLYGDRNPYTGEGKVSPLLKKMEKIAKLEKIHEMFPKEKEKVNTTDPDANIMQFSDKTKKPAYNGQIAVDGKENVIVAYRLTDEATDHYQLKRGDNRVYP